MSFDTITELPEWRGCRLFSCWDSRMNSDDADVGCPLLARVDGDNVSIANEHDIVTDMIKGSYKL